jgi:hypothetical protein
MSALADLWGFIAGGGRPPTASFPAPELEPPATTSGEGVVPEERRRVVAVAQATADLYKDFDPSRETWEEFGRRVVQAERTLTSLGFGVDVRCWREAHA